MVADKEVGGESIMKLLRDRRGAKRVENGADRCGGVSIRPNPERRSGEGVGAQWPSRECPWEEGELHRTQAKKANLGATMQSFGRSRAALLGPFVEMRAVCRNASTR
eukprot:scaffold304_cov248-Pinguiococcus_pyrenoidosus.AAC.30